MPPLDFDELRKSRTGKIIGIVLALLIALGLLLLTYSTSLANSSMVCLVFLGIALVLYAVPYYFGWKDKKRLAVAGLVLLIILGVALGFIIYSNYMGFQNQKVSSSDGIIEDGTVTPFRGTGGELNSSFSAVVTNSSYDNVTMRVWNAWIGSPAESVNSSGIAHAPQGNIYYFNKSLGKGLYLYQMNASSSNLNSTASGFGPINLDTSELLGQLIFSGLIVVLMQIGILFFLFLLLSTFTSRSRDRAKEQMRKNEELKAKLPAKEKFVCSECGAEVPTDANECPQCGEKFNEEAPKQVKEKEGDFVCTECGATVKEDDKRCWNCGKEFEN